MAAPTATTANTDFTSATDPWTVGLPASVAAGDLLLAFGRSAGGETFNLPTGWSWLYENNSTDASNDVTSVIAKMAEGGETNFSWDLSASAKGCAITYRIVGHNGMHDPSLDGSNIGTTSNINPNATSTLPSGDYLVVIFAAMDGETQNFTVPTNYSGLVQGNSGTGGAAASNCRSASASRALTGITSEDPGAWTVAAPSNGWTSFTLPIRGLVVRNADLKQHRTVLQAVNRGTSW